MSQLTLTLPFYKAYLLATRNPTYQAIARRIRAIHFLATPHRGADSAKLAKLVRRSAGKGAKALPKKNWPEQGVFEVERASA